MSDDLVKRLRGDWFGYEVPLKAIDAMDDAADRIEQLTAERDRLRALPAAQPPAQCCMCGKTGLDTTEHGGPGAQLSDKRWACSRECYYRAVDIKTGTLPAVQPHVNETPKSEHDAANVLTPATKGGE